MSVVSCQPCATGALAATDEVEAQAIANLLKSHHWIVSAQMSGFIADDLWSRLPEAWQAPLLALSDEEASRLPTDLPLPPDWPSDLAHLLHSGRAAARCGAEPTAHAPGPANVSECLLCHTRNVRNMGPKKQHEVLRLAPVIASLARRCGATAVVDIGSGMGCARLRPESSAGGPHVLS